MKLEWKDAKQLADPILLGYMDKAEVHCLEWLWAILDQHGLTTYTNEVTKTTVKLRLLAAVEFVNDCTALIREDSYELELVPWASETEVFAFRVAQIVGDDFESEEPLDDEELFEAALAVLTLSSREELIRLMQKVFPDPITLMYHIGAFYDGRDDTSDRDEDALIEIYGEPHIPRNVQAYFAWVNEGMPRRN